MKSLYQESILLFLASIFMLFAAILCTSARADPPKWTILRQVCWTISKTAGQCAVGLYGSYANETACMGANAGKLEVKAELPDGRKIAQRCEIHLEGD